MPQAFAPCHMILLIGTYASSPQSFSPSSRSPSPRPIKSSASTMAPIQIRSSSSASPKRSAQVLPTQAARKRRRIEASLTSSEMASRIEACILTSATSSPSQASIPIMPSDTGKTALCWFASCTSPPKTNSP